MKSSAENSARAAIWAQTFAVMIGYSAAIWSVSRYLQAGRVSSSWLAVALGFCIVQCVVIVLLISGLMIRKQWFLLQQTKSQEVNPVIQQHLAAVALGVALPTHERDGAFSDYSHTSSTLLGEKEAVSVLTLESSYPAATAASTRNIEKRGLTSFSDVLRDFQDIVAIADAESIPIEALRDLYRKHPRQFEICVVQFLPKVSGDARQRLSQLLTELGLVAQWQNQYEQRSAIKRRQAVARLAQMATTESNTTLVKALQDEEILIRIEAARGLIRSGSRSESERVFFYLATQNLMVRSLLVVDLLPHALDLSQDVIPQALHSNEPEVVMLTLKFIEAWGRTLPLSGYNRVLASKIEEVREQAFRALPFVVMIPSEDEDPAATDLEQWLRRGISDTSARVRAAASASCGQLRTNALFPELKIALEDSVTSVAMSAAFALARIEGEGLDILKNALTGISTTAASAALEALEKQQIGRIEV